MIKKVLKFLLLFIFFCNNLLAIDDDCKILSERIKKKISKDYANAFYGNFELINYGFLLEYISQSYTDPLDVKIKRRNGDPIVSSLMDLNLSQEIKSGMLLKKLNGQSLEKYTDKNIVDKILVTNKNNSAEFEFYDQKNKKTINKTIKSKKYYFHFLEPRLIINSINNIDTVNGGFELSYDLTLGASYPGLVNLITEDINVFKKQSTCKFNETEIKNIGIEILPFQFNNLANFSNDQVTKWYELAAYKTPNGTYDFAVYQREKGIIRFVNDFNFKKFPFDQQLLKIELQELIGIRNTSESVSSAQFNVTKYTLDAFNYYKNNNLLKEWNIKNIEFNVTSKPKLNYDFPFNSLEINLEIERSSLYYFIKIIFPIFLILSIAWSVFWINPKELESRITTSSVCFLALVAYNFVIDTEIPKLGYMTFMDWIIMISYIFCALPTLLSIFMYRIINDRKKLDIININYLTRQIGPICYFILLLIISFLLLF